MPKKFDGLKALGNVSFHIGDREILGLIGPNGAGKTKLLNAVAGVFPPDNGNIRFNGEKVTGLRPFQHVPRVLLERFKLQNLF